MSVDTVTRTAPLLDIAAIEEDLGHIVCEIHDRVALCGETFDYDRFEWVPEEGITCPVCAEADKQGATCGAIAGCPGERSAWERFVHRFAGGRRG